MTPQILLEKIIEKAVKGGWKPFWNGATWDKSDLAEALFDDRGLNGVLFDHSFARAYFGDVWPECILCKEDGKFCNAWHIEGWKRHLQELALTPPEERLSYLSKYL